MNLYKIVIDQYSTSTQKIKEIKADDIKFEGISINFYRGGKLFHSSPAALTRVCEIKYKKNKLWEIVCQNSF